MSYKNALKEYIDATNTHDFDNVKLLLHPDAIYWFTDRSCTTIKEIGKYFNHTWRVIKDEVYSATDIQWIAVDQTVATCIYTYHYNGYLDGEYISGSGRATNVFTFVENEWKLIHEHLSR